MARSQLTRPPLTSELLRQARRGGDPAAARLAPAAWPEAWKRVAFKELDHLPAFPLGDPEPTPLRALLLGRGSCRDFDAGPVTRRQIATLLSGLAILRRGSAPDLSLSTRAYPSAGARFPIDTYLAVTRATDLAPGAYFFSVRAHGLRQISPGSSPNDLSRIFGEPWTERAALAVFFVAQWQRTQTKYGERGYDFALIEAGHMAQNLLLAAIALGLGACPLGGIWEEEVERMFHLATPDESVVYSVVLGCPSRPNGGT